MKIRQALKVCKNTPNRPPRYDTNVRASKRMRKAWTRRRRVLYGVVSDVFTGKSFFVSTSAEDAAIACYKEKVDEHGGDEEADDVDFSPDNFRAWPQNNWPRNTSNEEAYDLIGKWEGSISGELDL